MQSSGTSKSLEVHIVAHIKREELAKSLSVSVDADHVWLDDGTLGEWRNHERAWKAGFESEATHVVILQDDALPVENLRNHVLNALKIQSDRLISLYTGTHRPRSEEVVRAIGVADKKKASWLSADTLMWGVGVVVPRVLIPQILDVCKDSKLPYDQRIGSWAEKTGNPVLYTWPSLVDHADEPTVIKGRSAQQGVRVAHRVGVPDWNDRVVEISRPSVGRAMSTKDRYTA